MHFQSPLYLTLLVLIPALILWYYRLGRKNQGTIQISSTTFTSAAMQRSGMMKKNIIVAYEPIWSIGTGKIPKIEELQKIFRFIKHEFKKYFKTKSYPIILYGGSVNSNNISIFSMINEIDGFLIGGASQSSKKFIDIIKNYYK